MLKVPAHTDEKLSYLQKGLRERLLCGGCEQYLNRNGEQYASKVLKKMDETEIPAGERSTLVTGVEYRPFKLFLMMQLWRAGVASDDFGRMSGSDLTRSASVRCSCDLIRGSR